MRLRTQVVHWARHAPRAVGADALGSAVWILSSEGSQAWVFPQKMHAGRHRPHSSALRSQPLKLKIYQHSEERKIWDPYGSQTEGLFIFKFLFVYFLVALGLRCSTWILIVSFGILNCTTQSLDVAVGSKVVVCGLSCSAACGILVPQSGIEPVFPALQGGFLTTGPPGKPQTGVLYWMRLCFANNHKV